MKINEFGKTGIRVSELGFGGSRIGGVFADSNGTKEALTVLGSAFDSGITFYDTANIYAQGESESLIGRAFRGRRDRVVFATKGGYSLPTRRNIVKLVKPLLRPLVQSLGLKRSKLPFRASGALSQNYSPSYLARALEGSLKRLRTDYVDLYQLHSPGIAFMQSGAFGEALETLATLQQQGKVRFFGIATEVPQEAPFCLGTAISAVQLGFGLLDLEALRDGTLADAAARGIGVIARGCFGGGLLKESLDSEQLKASTPKWERIETLRALSRGLGRSVLDIAFQFSRGTPGVSVTLLGMRTAAHLRENLRYLQAPALNSEEYLAFLNPQQPIAPLT